MGVAVAIPNVGFGAGPVYAAESEKEAGSQVGVAKFCVFTFVVTDSILHDESIVITMPVDNVLKDKTSAPLPLFAASHVIKWAFSAAAPASVLAYGKEKGLTVFN